MKIKVVKIRVEVNLPIHFPGYSGVKLRPIIFLKEQKVKYFQVLKYLPSALFNHFR